jgi:hypothetical protein
MRELLGQHLLELATRQCVAGQEVGHIGQAQA